MSGTINLGILGDVHPLNLALSAVRIIGISWLAVVILMFVFQRQLMYFPDPARVAPASVGLSRVSEVTIATPDGERLIAWWSPPAPGKPVVLYLQGNGGAPSHRPGLISRLSGDGRGVLALAYRSYGGSSGKPTETGLVADAKLAYDWLRERGVAADRLVVFGESLGSGLAVQLAAGRPVAGVILDSPYTSTADVAQASYPFVPVYWLMRDQFNSMAHIRKVTAPLLIIHGDRDPIIPYAHGKTLFAAANEPKQMLTIKDGAHTLAAFSDEAWAAIVKLLDQVSHRAQ